MKTIKLGLIGCGAIGSTLLKYAREKLSMHITRMIIFDCDENKSKVLADKNRQVVIADSMEKVFDAADLIIEAASPKIVPEFFEEALSKTKDIMIMSIGGLLGREASLGKAEEKGIKVILPSGAIAGIDGLKAAKVAGLEEVTITTSKPPGSIKGAPYLEEKGINVDEISEKTVIFEGSAFEAVKGFPKNINVSALLSIAGIGAEKTKVRIVVSPEYTRNTHEIKIKSKAGTITVRTENVPFPDNPKTSYLAALAAITSLESYFSSLRLGT
ncbi:MAG: aspartate dehydrogenase [Candidatus Omnitrophota bacterium]